MTASIMPATAPKKRRASAHPEHKLQIQCHKFANENILPSHKFLGFDRGRAHGQWSHEYERRRGLESGTADTLTRVKDFAPFWFELKDGANEPTDNQREFGREMIALGDGWGWGNSVLSYCRGLKAHGIPLRATAEINAEHLDRLLLAGKMKKAGKAPKSCKPRPQKPAPRQLAAAHRMWSGMR